MTTTETMFCLGDKVTPNLNNTTVAPGVICTVTSMDAVHTMQVRFPDGHTEWVHQNKWKRAQTIAYETTQKELEFEAWYEDYRRGMPETFKLVASDGFKAGLAIGEAKVEALRRKFHSTISPTGEN